MEAGLILHCLGVCPMTISIVNISIYFFNPHFTDEETEDCSKQLPNTTGLKFFFQRQYYQLHVIGLAGLVKTKFVFVNFQRTSTLLSHPQFLHAIINNRKHLTPETQTAEGSTRGIALQLCKRQGFVFWDKILKVPRTKTKVDKIYIKSKSFCPAKVRINRVYRMRKNDVTHLSGRVNSQNICGTLK